MKLKRILVPIDGSSFSKAILVKICQLFDPLQYQLNLLRVSPVPDIHTVIPDSSKTLSYMSGIDEWSHFSDWQPVIDSGNKQLIPKHQPMFEELVSGIKIGLVEELNSSITFCENQGFDVNAYVRFGKTCDEITYFAESKEIDFIAMCTHNRKGVERTLLGSVAQTVLDSTFIPVLMMRPMEENIQVPN